MPLLHMTSGRSVAVVVGDLYFHDGSAETEQEGAERGVRLEVRFVEPEPLVGSEYSAQPVRIGAPIWRVDLLETVSNPGSLDRTHHHPRFEGWEPQNRVFDEGLSADPFGWLASRLEDLPGILERAGVDAGVVDPGDAGLLKQAAPQLSRLTETLLAQVRAGELAKVPAQQDPNETTRNGWL